jgi:hypothetical protein
MANGIYIVKELTLTPQERMAFSVGDPETSTFAPPCRRPVTALSHCR